MMKNTYKRGFTLIELLVVIAIIGILASVVLASLNTARDKGANAAAKSSLNNMRAQAELFYDANTTNSYLGMCTAIDTDNTGSLATPLDDTIATGVAAAGTAAGATPVCGSTISAWAASVALKGGGFYCVDSTGKTGAAAAVGNACP